MEFVEARVQLDAWASAGEDLGNEDVGVPLLAQGGSRRIIIQRPGMGQVPTLVRGDGCPGKVVRFEQFAEKLRLYRDQRKDTGRRRADIVQRASGTTKLAVQDQRRG